MRTIAFLNQKGGVGKTTTAANLAMALSMRNLRIAGIDLDPQSHLTMHLGIEPGAQATGVYEMLTEDAPMSSAAVTLSDTLCICPACIDLAGAEIELVSTVGREQLLGDRLKESEGNYDYVIMDCPPSLGLLTLNALAAADEVIIPLQPHFLALQGFGKLLETISLVRKRVNPRLVVGGVILCMYESNTRLASEVSQEVQNFLASDAGDDCPWADARLYETKIRRNIKLAECPSFGESIFTYEPNCAGAEDYNKLAEEFIRIHSEAAQSASDQCEGQAPEANAAAANENQPQVVENAQPQSQMQQETYLAQQGEQPQQPNPPAAASGESPPATQPPAAPAPAPDSDNNAPPPPAPGTSI